jgi:hypothetical protein
MAPTNISYIHVSLCCRIKPWRSQTGAAAHPLLQPRQLHRHIVHQNHHPNPSGRHLQHRRNKKQRYILLQKKATNTPSQTAVSSHTFWYFGSVKANPLWLSDIRQLIKLSISVCSLFMVSRHLLAVDNILCHVQSVTNNSSVVFKHTHTHSTRDLNDWRIVFMDVFCTCSVLVQLCQLCPG